MINAEADLLAAGATLAGNAYTLNADGTYCFGPFTLTPARQIIVPDGRKVVLLGHGTKSLVQGNIDNGAVFVFQGQATVHMHDLKIKNNSALAGSRGIESSTTEAYLHDMAIVSNDTSEGLRITGGRLFATQLRISNVITGVSCRGGELFLQNYDCENLTNGLSIDASHSGLQWIGGRINDYAIALQVTNACQSIVLHGVTAVSGTDSFVKRTAGTVNRATIMGNTVAVTT
ncbi:MAG TPA: hypothetical protein VFS67_36065, partial [Polyangiaceae bacterium]|nr:hypothetical protein [Polyangiaceae bacterium]